MSSPEIEPIPSVLAEPNQSAGDTANASYDPSSLEGTRLVEELVKARLGEPYARISHDNYIFDPAGRPHGFQEEYPVDLFKHVATNGPLAINLVLKGQLIDRKHWIQTRVGLVGRISPEETMFFEELAVAPPYDPRNLWDLHSCQDARLPLSYGRAHRTVTLLRKAKTNLYLPQWIDHWAAQSTETTETEDI